MAPITARFEELFEFVPDGDSRPPDGPGMYTWMARREMSRKNLSLIQQIALPDGTMANLILFPEDVSPAVAAQVLNHLRNNFPALGNPAQLHLGHYFQGQWKQGQHDWSPRSLGLAIGNVDEAAIFEAASVALNIAGCDYILIRSALRYAVCLVSMQPVQKTKGCKWFPHWSFREKPDAWKNGKRTIAPLPVVRPFEISVTNPMIGDTPDHSLVCRHAHWLQLVRVFRAICPALTDEDERALTTRNGPALESEKALALLIALRSLLINSATTDLPTAIAGTDFRPDAERWFWPQVEGIYLLLCRGNGIEVQ